MPPLKNVRVIIITGLSGSGKSTALRALEDVGFFAVDNLPVALLPPFLDLRDQGEASKVALVMDIREPDFLNNYELIYSQLRDSGFRLEIIFLEAALETLIRRFSQTRRAHPALTEGSLTEAIRKEMEALKGLKSISDLVLDTTELSVHELKTRMIERFSSPLTDRLMRITLVSFGFKYGPPPEADMILDVRFLANPYFVEGLKEKDGRDGEIVGFLDRWSETARFKDLFFELLQFLLPLYKKEGKAYLTIGLGCTGGRHRSVALVEQVAVLLEGIGYRPGIRHRDIDRDREIS